MPLTLSRTYRPNDSVSRAFGIGTTHPYDIFIVFDSIPSTFADLILPDGGRIHFDCAGPPTLVGTCTPFLQHSTSPTEFYGETLHPGDSGTWKITMKIGTVLRFL